MEIKHMNNSTDNFELCQPETKLTSNSSHMLSTSSIPKTRRLPQSFLTRQLILDLPCLSTPRVRAIRRLTATSCSMAWSTQLTIVEINVEMDASAAQGMMQGRGICRLRHLEVQQLWNTRCPIKRYVQAAKDSQ